MVSNVSSSAGAPMSAVDKLSALPSITDLRAPLTDVVNPLNFDRWRIAFAYTMATLLSSKSL
ncbi:BQ5605_C001g00474 [Microbotryum silenes-dioicae]|uniref:BQ5605_C001g00474 protein n=1 Tax=Microbotryum silenes-dioicae TaxID=796604 RepID=A0A2X0MXV0_9BASI|nr:BQ5605_C001g00474 [Microbotryum silenes-dioicae]